MTSHLLELEGQLGKGEQTEVGGNGVTPKKLGVSQNSKGARPGGVGVRLRNLGVLRKKCPFLPLETLERIKENLWMAYNTLGTCAFYLDKSCGGGCFWGKRI